MKKPLLIKQALSLKGFTLIELLVVIAVIAIIAAILFPVFASAKRAAKTTTAISNLKQLGIAFELYEGDYDDTYPSATDGPLGVGQSGGWVWYDQFDYNDHGHFDVTKGTLYPYTKSTRVFQSPNDGEAETTQLSFAMNSCLVNILSGTGLTLSMPATAVQYPSSTMLVGEEGTGQGDDHSNDTNDGYFAAKYDHFSGWNSGGTAILFTDSHAKIVQAQSDAEIAALTSGGSTTLCN